ncbi:MULTISPECIES: DUF427 domain-containing protein [unclassified Rhodococcus (in: high G+C Gram-positive bacteria)]|uniref:DUF427 domain-containing protein n=1 Tax=unclassified Rhodococcus (in: high G+C Gram-positive bacteria) TaxID=192944 RepID=UPI0016397DDE|nr:MULTISPECIES: DUF427 domain-containing protein [unclassified Rhodococcus (in: high G+C Gram-positive bacteria)]MBC2639401.1 DUF427 domain-containing protein [Rhodococcus sp. 3A]MBC2895854.1 DUF427 domain-containing protein [Rhodococcus sp. 4CII]
MTGGHPAPDPVGPGQESVWDYPRPPAVHPSDELVEVWFGGQLVAHTRNSLRLLETSHPPTYYLPRTCFAQGVLRPVDGSTVCEWKGRADYFDLVAGGHVAERAAWHYPQPVAGYESLVGHVAVMPGSMDGCFVDGEQVRPQTGGFYGGWITDRVVGPFKGGPGSRFW